MTKNWKFLLVIRDAAAMGFKIMSAFLEKIKL
jgi:hypothetical protein